MSVIKRLCALAAFSSVFILTGTQPARAQSSATVYHSIEARLRYKSGAASNIRVRLLLAAGLQPVMETFSRPEGEVRFTNLRQGDYILQTFETETFEATETNVSVFPPDVDNPRPIIVTVLVDIPLKQPPKDAAPSVIRADVDLRVPKAARKRYEAGMKALDSADSERAIKELRSAVELYPQYYSARVELGRELRLRKRFEEAEEVLNRLHEIAPKLAEGRIEYGIVLLELGRLANAADELRAALVLDETNWAAHLFLGWALLDEKPAEALPHFTRALDLDELKAARAHLALARIAEQNGQRELALNHLDTYILLAPKAPDAEGARKLAERLRSQRTK